MSPNRWPYRLIREEIPTTCHIELYELISQSSYLNYNSSISHIFKNILKIDTVASFCENIKEVHGNSISFYSFQDIGILFEAFLPQVNCEKKSGNRIVVYQTLTRSGSKICKKSRARETSGPWVGLFFFFFLPDRDFLFFL